MGGEGRREEGRNNTKVKESLNGMQQERWSLSVQRGAEKAGAGGQDLGENCWAPDKDDGLTDMLSNQSLLWTLRKGKGSNKEPPKKQARSLLPTHLILAKQLSKYAD